MKYKVVKVLEEWYKQLSIISVHYVKCLLIDKNTGRECVRVVTFFQNVDYIQMLETMEIQATDKIKIYKLDELPKEEMYHANK